MSSLATKLAEHQQQISKAMADAKPPAAATTWASVVGNTAAGGAAASAGGVSAATTDAHQTKPTTEGEQAVGGIHRNSH